MILISCSDGRITGAAGRAAELAAQHGFDVSDHGIYRIKIPGPDGSAIGTRGGAHQDALRTDLEVLIEKAHAALVAVAGHCDCAGYPVSDEQHTEDTETAARAIHAWFPTLPVMGLIDEKNSDESWTYHEIVYLEPVKRSERVTSTE